MKDKILSALKSGIGKTSINDKTLNSYVNIIADKITDESQIGEAIKPYIEVLKEFQGNINSIASEAATAKETTVKAEYEKKIEELTKSKPDPTKQEEKKDVPEWKTAIEALTANVQTLATSFGAQQAEKTHEALTRKLTGLLSEKKVPEWYSSDILDGRTFKDETEVNAWADKISTKWGERNQELANNGFKETVPPGSGDKNVQEVDSIVATIAAGTQNIVEQNKK